jgi:ActR/RegA family two-component response regulator
MSISGSLKDVSVADVMQFIHLGRRTGTLLLQRGNQRAMIGFHGGRLVSAQAPRTPKLGDLLISSGMIDRGILDGAIRQQNEEPERRSLGQILVGSGTIDAEGLRQVIAQQIEQAVSEVMIWDTGTFEFAIDDLRPIDDIALYPSDVLPDADINTQMVLLEAARIFDEKNRDQHDPGSDTHPAVHRPSSGGSYADGDSTHPALLEPAPSRAAAATMDLDVTLHDAPPAHAAERLKLHVVSTDVPFAEKLAEALEHEVAGVELADLSQAGHAEHGEPPPIVLLDLRGNGGQGTTVEEAAAFRRSRPRVSLVALVEPGTSFARVYEAGALAALPADVEAVVACIENVIESRRDLVRGAPRPENRSGVARLRRVFGDLRSGLISATVALNLMHIISESVERAVLFLVKRDHLVALGAFGTDPKGRPLAEVTRALKVELDVDSALARSLDTGEVQNLAFDEADLPEPFRSMVGPPRNGQVVIFPVLGAQRVISVIYTDNGDNDKPIEDIDILELATAQVGMAFENELLRRQISQGK